MKDLAALLPYVIQCKWHNRPHWETIAAFDCGQPAQAYLDDCVKVNSGRLNYRLVCLEAETER